MFREGTFSGRHIMDQINMQASCADNLSTRAARELAKPLVDFMRAFVSEVEGEVGQGVDGG